MGLDTREHFPVHPWGPRIGWNILWQATVPAHTSAFWRSLTRTFMGSVNQPHFLLEIKLFVGLKILNLPAVEFLSIRLSKVGGGSAIIESSSPMWKVPVSIFQARKHPGDNTLKKEKWTKFEGFPGEEKEDVDPVYCPYFDSLWGQKVEAVVMAVVKEAVEAEDQRNLGEETEEVVVAKAGD
ncbi:unnamed protein product [Ilex paraguariensis]|uniref:Uncharacterized protein n=1 Tax=Ilex paraguariensis TaxID=185542 RepID=A0ABC8TZB8_9AQUA